MHTFKRLARRADSLRVSMKTVLCLVVGPLVAALALGAGALVTDSAAVAAPPFGKPCSAGPATERGLLGDAVARRRPLRFGAYAPPSPESGIEPTEQLERQLGQPIEIVNWYQDWGGAYTAFDPVWVDRVVRSGRTPLLTWEPWAPGEVRQPAYALSRLTSGAHDGYIRGWARAIRSYGKVIYLRPMHEMNGYWYPWGGRVNGNSPARFVAAWRRIWGIFDQERVHNVRWVWSPYVEDVPGTPGNALERYYPGRRYVDVLAVDGYNWGSEYPQYGGWRSWDSLFSCAYRRLVRLGPQPVWVAETASASEGGDKAKWVENMFRTAKRYPRLEALLWFHANKERDWRATSSPRVARAFAAHRR
jgi:hypothetical protein